MRIFVTKPLLLTAIISSIAFIGCSRREVSGNVCVTTKGGDTAKLDHAIVISLSESRMFQYLDHLAKSAKRENIFSQTDQMGVDRILRRLGLTSERIKKYSDDKFEKSQIAVITVLSKEFSVDHAKTKTNSDGSFTLSGISSDDVILVFASKEVLGELKFYVWSRKISNSQSGGVLQFSSADVAPDIRSSLSKIFSQMPEISKDSINP